MDDKERIQSFGDMVNATEKLTKPWRIALIVTNALWFAIVAILIWFAYMAPVETYQNQDFGSQVQTQQYSDGFGATQGD